MPALETIQVRQVTVLKNEPMELVVGLSAQYSNPFDREQVALEATFVAPSGAEHQVWGYYHEEYDYANKLAVNSYPFWDTPECVYVGSEWRVRFKPDELGEWRYRVKVTDSTGSAESGEQSLVVADSNRKGGVRISEDKQALVYDDGSRYLPIGFNIPWYSLSTYDYYSKLAENRATCIRILANYRTFELENNFKGPNPGDACLDTALGDYRGWGLMQMWKLEWILDLLHQRGMKVLLCMHSRRALFDTGTSKYLAANGGPCASRQDYWGFATDANLITNKWTSGAYEVWIDANLNPSTTSISNLLQADAGAVYGPLVFHIQPDDPACELVIGIYKGDPQDHLRVVLDGQEILYHLVGSERSYEVRVPIGAGSHTVELSDAGPDNPQLWNNIQLNYVRFMNYRARPEGVVDAIYYQRRALDYMISRFGHHPGLMGWELWNEFDSELAPWGAFEYDRAVEWADGYLGYIKENDPQGRPTLASLVNRDTMKSLFALDNVDVTQSRLYATSGQAERWNWYDNELQREWYGKLSITGEDGLTYDEMSKQSYRNLIFGNAAEGSGSLHFIQQNVEKLALWKEYERCKELLGGMAVDAIFAPDTETEARAIEARDLKLTPWRVWLDSARPTLTHTVGQDGSISDEQYVNKMISGTKWTTQKENNFVVDYAEAGEFRFKVSDVSTSLAVNWLAVYLDGQRVFYQGLTKAEHCGQTFSIQIPAGQHTIRLVGDGQNCFDITISEYTFTGYQRQRRPVVKGRRNAASWWMWAHNPENELPTYESGETPEETPATKLVIKGVMLGQYEVSAWEGSSGRRLLGRGITVRGCELEVELPGLLKDAVIVARSPELEEEIEARIGAWRTASISETRIEVVSIEETRNRWVGIIAGEAQEISGEVALTAGEKLLVSVWELAGRSVKSRVVQSEGAYTASAAAGEAVVVEVVKEGGAEPEVDALAITASGPRAAMRS